MIALGVDPGLVCGLAVVEERLGDRHPLSFCVLAAQTIRTKPNHGDAAVRYGMILTELCQLVVLHAPEVIGVEDQRTPTVGAMRRKQTNADALHTLIVQGGVHGVGMALSAYVLEVQTSRAKMAVCGAGGGKADKDRVERAVERIPVAHGVRVKSEHSRDAVAVAIAAIGEHRRSRLIDASRAAGAR